ncbi:MAG: helix-turn-helix transcriptional regulator [Rhodoluna sp.]|nr:helix-turn-helix transcriptional regulator [Rhodoluna sp.]MBP6186341.1 helix-turn-helix transcriptional regulator [Rhodoluna sp.]
MALIRQEIGDVLRDFRTQKGQTLRQVAARANVALGYLSEVERGQKEASSEILASLAEALEIPVSLILREVSDRLAILEGVVIPDIVPETFAVQAISGKQFGDIELDEFDAFLIGSASNSAKQAK